MMENQPGRPFLSVVIPAHNEESRIAQTLAAIRSFLEARDFSSEIIVVDDGSTDRTAEIAARALEGIAGSRIVRLPRNRGKGAAVREGILQTGGKLILFSDADLSTPIEELDKLLPWIAKGFDVIIGSRALPGSDIQVRQSRIREFMGKTFNFLVRLFIMKGIRDTQCGFKLFRREAALCVFPMIRTEGFSFDVEALHLCRGLDFRIQEVPIVWRHCPQSKVRMIRSSFAMLRDLWKIKRRSRPKAPSIGS
jgi:dolichyl-phosphate beta-glucosyltransferase